MQITSHHGIVVSLMLQPFAGSEDDNRTRDQLFELAGSRSGCPPVQRMDIFDETLLTFDRLEAALDFILEIIGLVKQEFPRVAGIRSGLCCGEYFLHGEQIYGAAINLATQLSFMSRQNELLTGGIETESVRDYACSRPHIHYTLRDPDKLLICIGLLDEDSTLTLIGKSYLHIKSANCHKILTPQRNVRISIGRLPSAEIYIDSEHVSRQHATLILKDDQLFLEDHSANGTYVYDGDKELFLNRNACQLGRQGAISCGRRQEEAPEQQIFYEFRETGDATSDIPVADLVRQD